ncbi:MAG: hypothetical protein IH884_12965 [Myxococcales bacterium]|nr:hypothetical protein [Myxococcales bacterium]
MTRKRFDHLHVEVSLALGVCLSRFALWLALHEEGHDPEHLTRQAAVAFCGAPLQRFLAERGQRLSLRDRRRVEKAVSRYDPSHPTPAEVMARF